MSGGLFDLSGRIALVTGSSQGLGLVIAEGLGRAGAEVVLNGRDQAKLDKAVAALKRKHLNAHGFAFDVTAAGQVAGAVSQIERQIGPIDILVNSAGIMLRSLLVEMTQQTWQQILQTNLTGAFLAARQVAVGMIERKKGKIINVCSLMSEVGRATTGAYAAAKGGLKMLTRAMAVEWGPHNIQVNGIGPGYFLTEMTRLLSADVEFDSWIKKRTPAGRWGNPEELVGPAVFLASDASSFINGQILYVDGGILASL